MVPVVTSSRQKRDQIVWTDLVFRVPPRQQRTEVPKEEIRRTPSVAVTPAPRPRGSSCRLGKKKNQQKKSRRLRGDSVRDEEAEVVEGSPPPHPSRTTGAPSASGNLSPQGKHKVVSLLVDLRPILENVLDPSEEGPEEKDLGKEAHPSSSPGRGDPSGKVMDPPEKAEEKDSTKDGCPFSNAGDPSREDHKTESATLDSGDGQADQNTLLPPTTDSCGDHVSLAAGTPTGIWSPPGETGPLWRNDSQAVQFSQPEPRTPMSSPPQQQGLRETDGTRVLLKPTPPSPDFQLPTQLLLQRLQETTTSKNHLLILQVLRSLREELVAEDSDDGDKWNRVPELPVDNPGKRKPQASRRKPVAAKKEPGKLSWYRNRTFHAAGLDRRLQTSFLGGLD